MKISRLVGRLAAICFSVSIFAGTVIPAYAMENYINEYIAPEEDSAAEGSSAPQTIGKAMLMQAIVSEDSVKAYVRRSGGPADPGATYQIGNVPVDEVNSYSINDDLSPMRTLILVDNSISIPENMRGTIEDSIKRIIAARGSSELFRIGTFSDTTTYLNDNYNEDYTGLDSIASSIKYSNQDTFLTDVLYDIFDEFEDHPYKGYTRIIIFSDGVDNNPIGITREELNARLSKSGVSIYTFGITTKNNSTELENMFAISRLTGSEYAILEKDKSDDVAAITAEDTGIYVYEAKIPGKLKDGSTKNSKLTFSDGAEVTFDVELPFSIEATMEITTTEASSIEASVEIIESTDFPEPWMIYTAIGIFAFMVVVVILVIALSKSKKKNQMPDYSMMPTENFSNDTELFGFGQDMGGNRGTEQLTPQMFDGQKHYIFTMTDNEDDSRSFRCQLADEISIGRMEDNHIIIADDNSVHRHHATVTNKNGTFFYTDLKDVKNRSSINGIALKPAIPQLIVTNSVVKIGRRSYTITISEGY